MNSHSVKPLALTIAGLLLGACASSPEQVAEVDRARAAVRMLAENPLAQEAASRELASARDSLANAEMALEDREDESIEHYSYLASQQAKTGLARVGEARAREEVARGEAERNRVLLEARTREAARATAQAEQQARLAEGRAVEAESARAEAEQALQEAERTRQQLEELEAKQTERGMVLTLGDVLFDTAAASIKPGAMDVLDRVATFMRDHEEMQVIVEGHTDSRGSEEFNQQLSMQRAQSVAQALGSRGVDADRIRTVGRGEAVPVASNDTAAGQQLNRRVELVFSDPEGQFVTDASDSRR
jgi:outer membrane protein OmpA-like peptidoglycan-associated protein